MYRKGDLKLSKNAVYPYKDLRDRFIISEVFIPGLFDFVK